MARLKIVYEYAGPVEVVNVDTHGIVDLLLAEHNGRTRNNDPVFIRLEDEDFGTLGIGVGVPNWLFFTHNPADGEPPYSRSVGNVFSSGSIIYLYDGSPTEILVRNTVSSDHLASVVSAFVTNGILS